MCSRKSHLHFGQKPRSHSSQSIHSLSEKVVPSSRQPLPAWPATPVLAGNTHLHVAYGAWETSRSEVNMVLQRFCGPHFLPRQPLQSRARRSGIPFLHPAERPLFSLTEPTSNANAGQVKTFLYKDEKKKKCHRTYK